jgi:hypothetical protein
MLHAKDSSSFSTGVWGLKSFFVSLNDRAVLLNAYMHTMEPFDPALSAPVRGLAFEHRHRVAGPCQMRRSTRPRGASQCVSRIDSGRP